jgi:hypothetical protein
LMEVQDGVRWSDRDGQKSDQDGQIAQIK